MKFANEIHKKCEKNARLFGNYGDGAAEYRLKQNTAALTRRNSGEH